MSDLIDRQSAIDAVEFGITYAKAINKSTGEVKELFKEGNKALNEAVERLKELPSAQSERCEDCVNFSKTRLLISPAQPEMTTTAITQAKRFCRYQGIMCEYATDMGCCEITGCAKRRTGWMI